jgi:hypothetical protein
MALKPDLTCHDCKYFCRSLSLSQCSGRERGDHAQSNTAGYPSEHSIDCASNYAYVQLEVKRLFCPIRGPGVLDFIPKQSGLFNAETRWLFSFSTSFLRRARQLQRAGYGPARLHQTRNPDPHAATPDREGWIHEIDYDGYRTLIVIDQGRVRALLPPRQTLDGLYRRVVAALRNLILAGVCIQSWCRGRAASQLAPPWQSIRALFQSARMRLLKRLS